MNHLKLAICSKHSIVIIAILIYWGSLALSMTNVTNQTGGKLFYLYDDAYIHMTMARNFADHGMWGVTPDEFSSSTSSPLWTLLLAIFYKIAGNMAFLPLWMNVAAGTCLLVVVYQILSRHQLPSLYIFIVLLCVVGMTPLVYVTFSGMEHLLHSLITVLYLYFASMILSDSDFHHRSKVGLALLGLTPLLVMVRYEGLFLIAGVVLLLLARPYFRFAIMVVGLAAAPTVIYGALNISNGWFYLPATVLLKSGPPLQEGGIFQYLLLMANQYSAAGYAALADEPLFTFLAGLGIFLFLKQYAHDRKLYELNNIVMLLIAFMVVIHVSFIWARVRYESYLVVTGIFAFSLVLYQYFQNLFPFKLHRTFLVGYITLAIFAAIATAPLAVRSRILMVRVQGAMLATQSQQYQMALFVSEFYNDEAVILRDIGYVNYLADIRCLDYKGLGTLSVAEKILSTDGFTIVDIELLGQEWDAKIAILFPDEPVPERWIPVGSWTTSDEGFLANQTVVIYALDSQDVDSLVANLQAFSPQLPDRVVEAGLYLDDLGEEQEE